MNDSLRATVAGLVATFLASLALIPAYQGQQWLGLSLLVVIFVAATGLGLRQIGTPPPLVPLGQLAALSWASILVFARKDLWFGVIPSSESVEAFTERIGDGLSVVVRYAAPVPYDADLVMVTALGIGLVAIMVDALCATFRLTPWAGLPLLLLYSIPATTVSGGVSALAFIPASVGYIVLLVSEGRERLSRWGRVIGVTDGFSKSSQDGVQTSLLGQTGRRVGAMVIGLAVVVPALLPAMPQGMFGQGQGTGFGSSGQTIRVDNPIVDLRRDLRLPQNLPVLRYRTTTDNPDYIKLVTLDDFDGDRWRPSQRKVSNFENGPDESSDLPEPPGLGPSVPRTQVRTTFSITDALESRWLPTPYPPTSVKVPGEWGYDPETLDIVSRGRRSAGLTYEVTSLEIDFDAEGLDAAGRAPSEVFSRYTELPSGLPPLLRRLAREQTAQAETQFDKAVALQRWFRVEGDFTYDLNVQPGHGDQAMVEFLTDRRGYCEQFAAAMALMARSLGIPARVAVGYLPGTRQSDDSWLVTAHDSHAWPELYFAEYGWVRFEPTPQAQTGLPPPWTVPSSDTSDIPSPEQVESPGTEPTPTASASAAPAPNQNDRLGPTGLTPPAQGVNVVPILLVIAGVLAVGSLPLLIRLLIRRIRLSPLQTRAELVEGVWRELADIVVDAGLHWDPAATPRAVAARLRLKLAPHDAMPALMELVHAVERARYAPDPGDVSMLPAPLFVVARALRAEQSRLERIRRILFPPSLLRRVPQLWRPIFGLLDRLDTAGARSVAQLLRLGR